MNREELAETQALKTKSGGVEPLLRSAIHVIELNKMRRKRERVRKAGDQEARALGEEEVKSRATSRMSEAAETIVQKRNETLARVGTRVEEKAKEVNGIGDSILL